LNERIGIVGSGTIACGLAATAAHHGPVALLARSQSSAERARATVEKTLSRMEAEIGVGGLNNLQVYTDISELAHVSFAVEAVVEDYEAKTPILSQLNSVLDPEAIVASTTSSLSVERLAAASGRGERFVGLHVFNPVTRMKLVELIFPAAASSDTRARALALCAAFEKTAVEVPDVPGFVVNRLLFPYLFSAVRLLEETGMDPNDIDTCMKLGAGHPMGPFALLDLVGLDVSKAIGETIGEQIPPGLDALIAQGALGRKTKRGFLSY
jgi:3-hydroxybutyryl-CoA dehydrogenase